MATQEAKVIALVQNLTEAELTSLPIPLTPERKRKLQAPKSTHKRSSWMDEALDDLNEAIELGELE